MQGDFPFCRRTYFPHYTRRKDATPTGDSALHLWLDTALPAAVDNPEGIRQACAAPRGEAKTTFVDVPENSWYADAADFVAQRGLMSGVGENLFGGNQNTTRAMLMTILARMDGQDVTGGATWYEKAMNWAKQTGVSDGTMPEVNITREQLATMLYSYAKLKRIDTTQGGMAVREFNDYDSISGWAGQSMTWAVNAGILSGRGNNTLAPTAGATRAEMAVMLQQFVGLMEQ